MLYRVHLSVDNYILFCYFLFYSLLLLLDFPGQYRFKFLEVLDRVFL